ncbi:hypothetical protein ASD02_26810 [Ensifer sp. Root1252]|nr:hypothetical protein ASD02_26810 [Ensifer sp. Root1252]KRC77736.1 hypothetical protein ASE32_29105 [Ensifer sp. Root231]KRC99579.1 hypothetical protein ASE47_27715 [Ensifer sp. Root258]
MSEPARVWERVEAENHFTEVLDGAKAGQTQRISDSDGVFEITYSATTLKERAGQKLARGGPSTE